MPRGRPTKLTKEVMNTIVTAVRAGNYVETAAALAGVSKETLYDWLRRGARYIPGKSPAKERIYAEFSDAVKRAMAESEAEDLALIKQAALQGNWQAVAWRLERRFPDRWGRRTQVQLATEEADDPLRSLAESLRELRRQHGVEDDSGDETGPETA